MQTSYPVFRLLPDEGLDMPASLEYNIIQNIE